MAPEPINITIIIENGVVVAARSTTPIIMSVINRDAYDDCTHLTLGLPIENWIHDFDCTRHTQAEFQTYKTAMLKYNNLPY